MSKILSAALVTLCSAGACASADNDSAKKAPTDGAGGAVLVSEGQGGARIVTAPVGQGGAGGQASGGAMAANGGSSGQGGAMVGSGGRVGSAPDAAGAADGSAGGSRADMAAGQGGSPGSTAAGNLVVYAQDGARVQIISVDRATGELTKKEAVDACKSPLHLQVDRAQKFLVAACNSDKGIAVLSIDKVTGGLTKIGQASGGTAVGVGLHPSGGFALTPDYDGGATLYKLAPDGKPEKVQSVGAGSMPHGARFDGLGKFAYVTNAGSNSINQFAFDGGKLSPLSPATVTVVTSEPAGAKEPRYLVDSPDGKFIFVIGQRPPAAFAFKVGDTGGLSKIGTGAAAVDKTDMNGKDIVLSPAGDTLYATIYANNTVAIFSVDKASGAVTFKKAVDTGSRGPSQITMDPAGQMLFVAHQATGDVVAFQIEKGTGMLTVGKKITLSKGNEGVIAINLVR